ncbi:C39 family peptidase [Candidatus Deferrimicrobium sp.]|uniref:C39 family peptidase n=1 Tax=Candidatus Deferrimicrobium sp. TaxID=3060586 RepID=UPI003C6EE5E8
MEPVANMRTVVLGVVVVILAAAVRVHAAPVAIPGMSGSVIILDVTSKKESQFRSTMRQRYDFSCGSAALATLLSSGYEDAVSEGTVFSRMYEAGDKERIRNQGFSLLDMKTYLESEGYMADGYRVPLEKLAELRIPAITVVSTNGYKHFVVIKGVAEKEVLVSDPAAGTTVILRSKFETMWNGILFLIRNRKNVATNHFNRKEDWQVRTKAPIGTAMGASELGGVTNFLARPAQ